MTNRIAVVGGTVIDGSGRMPISNGVVLIEDGRISSVFRLGERSLSDNFELIEAQGRYLIPGLIDANVHLVADTDPAVLLSYGIGEYDELVLEAAQVALKAGITTVFDTFGPLDSLRRVRDRINSGNTLGSRIFFAGNIIGMSGPWSEDFDYSTHHDLTSDVIEAVNRQWERDVGPDLLWMPAELIGDIVGHYIASSEIDFVKYSSSAHKENQFIAFSPDAQRAIVKEAHAAGMTAQACAQTPEALKLSMQAGVDLLQHGDITGRHPMPQEMLDLIVERQLPCVAFLMTERHIDSIPETIRNGLWRDMMRVKDENDRRLIDAGAKLLLANDMGLYGRGSRFHEIFAEVPDVPSFLGTSHNLWMQAAIERGMAPMDVLTSATRNVADAYGKGDDLGTLEPGKRADILILEADPLDDIANYRHVAAVIKDGMLVDRSSLPHHPILTDPENDQVKVVGGSSQRTYVAAGGLR